MAPNLNGGHDMAPKPPNARRAPAKPWRASIPNARRAPAKPWRAGVMSGPYVLKPL